MLSSFDAVKILNIPDACYKPGVFVIYIKICSIDTLKVWNIY